MYACRWWCIRTIRIFLTSHANVRFLLPKTGRRSGVVSAAGSLRSPTTAFEEDAVHWHRTARDLCQPFGDDVYPRYKSGAMTFISSSIVTSSAVSAACFLDDLNMPDFDHCFAFMQAVSGQRLHPGVYLPDCRTTQSDVYRGERERTFQLYRRAVAAEFNLATEAPCHFPQNRRAH